jgi:hypothetical protein
MNTNEHEWNQNHTGAGLRAFGFGAQAISDVRRAGLADRPSDVSGTRLVKSPFSVFVFIRVHSWFSKGLPS